MGCPGQYADRASGQRTTPGCDIAVTLLCAGEQLHVQNQRHCWGSSMISLPEVLRFIDPARPGLEIGPLDKPLLTRPDFNVEYVDHLDRDGLREKYSENPFVDVEEIIAPDYVTQNKPLSEIVGTDKYSYIVASHVIEHVPSLLGFFAECAEVLTDGGIISLVAPDKRYSFDITRRLSTFADIVSAFIECRTSPSIRDICDHYFEVRRVSPDELWRGVDVNALKKYHTHHEAMNIAASALRDARFIDCHVWVFTCDTFLAILRKSAAAGLLPFEVIHAAAPIPGEMDFYCSLRKHGRMASVQ